MFRSYLGWPKKPYTRTMRNKHLRFEPLELKLFFASDGWDGPGLGNASLTYYIADVPSAIDETEFRETIAAAFAAWTDVVDIEIQETPNARQRDSIDIAFGEIDGPGDVLAQAYLPEDVNRGRIAGDIVFDVDESWEFGNEGGREATDLMLVAVHEIGHSLGLEHLDNQDSVMYESVSPNSMFTRLDQSDMDAILALYAPQSITLQGDFDLDGALTADDIDLLFQQIGSGDYDSRFDLNVDDVVDHLDSDLLIHELFGTAYGDANLDGVVDSQDLNQVALNWQGEDNLGWRDGDFTGDGLIDAADLNRIGSNWSVAATHKGAMVDSIPIVMAVTNDSCIRPFSIRDDERRHFTSVRNIGTHLAERTYVSDNETTLGIRPAIISRRIYATL